MGTPPTESGEFRHRPVLLEAVLEYAAPALEARPDVLIVDGTAGGGGHSEALLDAAGTGARLIGIDRDPAAIEAARARLARFGERARVVHGSYGALDEAVRSVGWEPAADVILVDLGVSSPQLDRPERGFSFMKEGPLDMRFDSTRGATAGALLEKTTESELAHVLAVYGEVQRPRRAARAILKARDRGELNTTTDLARAVEHLAAPARRSTVHPATLVFQALRIVTNDELGALRTLLHKVPGWLRPGGRVLAVSFHSLEDRLVKRALAFWEQGPEPGGPIPLPPWPAVLRRVTRRPVAATAEEAAGNPRARSAKLRVAERTAAPVPPGHVPPEESE